jgi:GMP synthase-like glutamine amidotransferase
MSPSQPVLILQHLSADGPAYLRTWLQVHGVAHRVFDAEALQAYPSRIDGYRALAVLGGEMSANDDLPALRDGQHLIAQAFEADVPVIGHCLGGQLMARVLGAAVVPANEPEIGWHRVRIEPTAAARDWFAGAREATLFEWHRERFELPAGACSLASSPHCAHQAFSYGRHLALQFHLELDREKLWRWAAARDLDSAARPFAGVDRVDSGTAMRALAAHALSAQHRLADAVYRRWLSGT